MNKTENLSEKGGVSEQNTPKKTTLTDADRKKALKVRRANAEIERELADKRLKIEAIRLDRELKLEEQKTERELNVRDVQRSELDGMKAQLEVIKTLLTSQQPQQNTGFSEIMAMFTQMEDYRDKSRAREKTLKEELLEELGDYEPAEETTNDKIMNLVTAHLQNQQAQQSQPLVQPQPTSMGEAVPTQTPQENSGAVASAPAGEETTMEKSKYHEKVKLVPKHLVEEIRKGKVSKKQLEKAVEKNPEVLPDGVNIGEIGELYDYILFGK